MVALLDVNVLIALAWPNHVHHRPVAEWFRRRSPDGWATCSVTEAGFVRVSANRKVVFEPCSPAEARQMLRRIVALAGHQFWPDDISLADTELVDDGRLLGYRQVTDAHLVALAIRHTGSVATLDRSVLDVVPSAHEAESLIELLS